MTATAALAQESETKEDKPVVEKIEVTGSRIKRVDLETVSPVTVITAEDIALSGDTSVADVMRTSSLNSFGSMRGQSGYGAGSSTSSEVNLRGLGSGATLVLLDGRRLPGVGYDGGSSADMSMIPMAVVERIEILRDGASAVYGSDAVAGAGVINIITKKQFDGISFGYSYENPGVDGGNTNKFDFPAGATGDKGSIVFVAEHSKTDEVTDVAINGRNAGESYSSYSPIANFYGYDSGELYYNQDLCNEHPDTVEAYGYCKYYYGNSTWLYGRNEKNSVMTKIDYELADNITYHSRFSALQNTVQTRYAATPIPTSTITIDADNAMNPYGEDGKVYYRTEQLGVRDSKTEKTTVEIINGLEGIFGLMNREWDWQFNYQYTLAKEEVFNYNLVNDTVIQELIDTEQLDLFNVQGLSYDDWYEYNAGVLDDARHTGIYQVTQKRNIIDGNIASELYVNGDFSVNAVFGFEYEDLDFTQQSDPESGQGFISGGSGGDDVFASRERQSYYTEFAIGLPFNIEVSAALRYDGYTLEGDTGSDISHSEFSDTVPKLGVSWRPTDDILIRASWGQAFRTPTMTEMFATISYGFPSGYDTYYCDILGNESSEPDYCNSGQQHLTYYGGNPDLLPEHSDALTVGFVYNITEDLSIEMSYYQYDYKDKIESLSVSSLIELDTNGNSSNIERDSQGKIVSITSGYANYSTVNTNGWDLTANYHLPTQFGDLGFGLEFSHIIN